MSHVLWLLSNSIISVMVQWCIKDIKKKRIHRKFILYINHTNCVPTTACNTIIILWKMLNCANQLKFSQQWLRKIPSSAKPLSLMGVQWSFEATYCLQVQGSRVIQANNQQAASITSCLIYSDPPIHQWTSTRLHGVKSRKTVLCFIDRQLLKKIIGRCVVFKILETDTNLLQPVFKYIFVCNVTFPLCTLLQWPCLY